MKKLLVAVLVGMVLIACSPVQAATGRGGFMGFVAGCCFGVRTGGAYNDGKEVHWREWIRLVIPIIPQIWDGVEGAKGVTSKELAARYGAMCY